MPAARGRRAAGTDAAGADQRDHERAEIRRRGLGVAGHRSRQRRDAGEPRPDTLFFTGSVRKLFSVGSALNALGAGHQFRTPAYATGTLNGGVLDGDLVIVADGDLTLGGRDDGAGGIAFTDFDHTEANSLGSAILTEGDPLAGVVLLARQVAAAGVTRITGDVVVDDRLFVPFVVPNGKVLITPAIVNDNLIDVTILPTAAGQPAKVDWRPKSAGFTVRSEVTTVCRRRADQSHADAGRGRRRRQRHRCDRLCAGAPRRADAGEDLHHPRPLRLSPHRLHRGAHRGRRRRRRPGGRPQPGGPAAGRLCRRHQARRAGLAGLRAIRPADPQGQPQHRCQPQPDAARPDQGGAHDRCGARGRKAGTGRRLRAAGGRLRLPDQRQRQPRQPGDAGRGCSGC